MANVPAGNTPQFVAADPRGTRVYVSTHGEASDGLVTVIDTSTYQIVANIPVGKNPTGLVVNPAGTRLYVLNSGDNTMSIIDTATNGVIGLPVSVASGPYEVVVSADGKRLYISAESAGAIQVLDAANGNQIGALIPTGGAPAGVALNTTGTLLYVANFVRAGQVVDLQAGRLQGFFAAGPGAIAIIRDPAGRRLYAADFKGGQGTTVSVLDANTYGITATINVGTGPYRLAMNSAGTALYVTNSRSDNVSVVDPSTNAVVATTAVDSSPLGVVAVSAGPTTPPPMLSHIASAVNGRPVFDPAGTTAFLGSTIQFTVRVPNIAVGSPAEVRYYLNPNLQLLNASAGRQTRPCQAATFTGPLPNGVQGEASSFRCSLTDGSKPLIITTKVIGNKAPRDDPYAAVACFPTAFTKCAPVRVSVVTKMLRPTLGTRGAQRTALILVNAPGASPHPYANKTATASVFYSSMNPGSAQSFFVQASYGLMTITGADPAADGTAADIYGPYTAPSRACFPDAIALADRDIDFRLYDRVVVLANNPDCTGGIADVFPRTHQTGEGPRDLTSAWISNTDFGDTVQNGKIGNETLHEYGHTLGLQHAGAWYCVNASVSGNGCFGHQSYEPIDLVSEIALYAHPNSVHKELLGWLESGRVFPIWSSGTYTINAYEDGTENVKVLKIPRKLRAAGAAGSPAAGYYYLSYRRPAPPWDNWTANAPSFTNGIAIHIDESGSGFDSGLLDATPGSAAGLPDIKDGALLLNQTFRDPLSGITVVVSSISPNAAQVVVTIQPRTTRFVQAAIEPETGLNILGSDVGSVTGGGSYNPRVNAPFVQLSAAAQPGWGFFGWIRYTGSQGQLVSQANPYRFPAADDRVLFATFRATAPPNDNFAGAIAIQSLPSVLRVFTVGAGSEPGEPYPVNTCGAGIPHGRTIWYSYTPANDRRVTIDEQGSDNAIDIGVYTGNTINSLTPVPGACGVWTAQRRPRVTFSAIAGTKYRIQLDTTGGNTVATLTPAPTNDDFAAATPVITVPTQSSVVLRGATVEAGEPQPSCFGGIDLSAWYTYTPAVTGTLNISATYGGTASYYANPAVAVYTGAGLGNLTLVPGGCNFQSASGRPDLTVPVTAGTTYWIQVSGLRSDALDPAIPTTITFQ